MSECEGALRDLRAWRVAERLFSLMPDFDRFDSVLHALDAILSETPLEELRDAAKYYDLGELRAVCAHYIKLLERITERLDEVLGGE